MAYISDNELTNIRNSVSIVDVIANYIPLTLKGKNYFGVCPFHEDHSPSMSVSKEKQIYKCFSCGATGNVFTFLENYLNISFSEAVGKVAEMSGINLSNGFLVKQVKKNKEEYDLMALASKLFQNNLHSKDGKKALDYLKNRGINEAIIKDFDIGLALGNNNLYEVLSKKYDNRILEDIGLINNNLYDTFQNRIIFPIHNLTGDIVGFTGRVYDAGSPKYLNSKETKIFKKGNILFNYHLARDAIRLKKEVILVEGNMDAIRLYASGIKNVIALMGTSMTKEQVQAIKKLHAKVILMFDNDDAGSVATFNNGRVLEKEGLYLKIVRLSGTKDPDEYILKYGASAIEETIKNAISFIEFQMNYLKQNKNLNDSLELSNYIKLVLDSLKETDDEILKDITLQKLADDYNISYAVLKNELSKIIPSKERQKEEVEVKTSKTNLEKLEERILLYMMNGYMYTNMYSKRLGILPDKKYRSIANEITYFYSNNKNSKFADFLTFAQTLSLKSEIMAIINDSREEVFTEEGLLELIGIMQKKIKRSKIKTLKKEMNEEFDINKKIELANKLIEIKKGSVDNEND